ASSEVNPFSSKYDYYLAGEAELTALEMEGLDVFEGAGFCSSCHPAPLFTNYTFDNLGIPKNPDNPFYDMDQVYLDNGEPINPMGDAWIDKGLGGFLESHPNEAWRAMAAENMGKHRVPTLRNVAKSPRKDFTKAFGHNGVFKSLEEIVHFYNTRDVADWASPEVAENINSDELGDLALTEHEEAALVAFLETLSDGWTPAGSSE
ncbi:MAG: cytochrome C, partial [Candidatus Latescibacterota bacterium]